MASGRRRLSAGWNRRSRIDPRLWILGACLLLIALGLWIAYAGALPVYSPPSLPWWIFAIAFFAASRLASIDSPRHGTQSITLAAAPFVVGLFHATPLALLLGYALGTAARSGHPPTARRLADRLRHRPLRGIRGDRDLGLPQRSRAAPTSAVWHSALGAIAATAITVLRRAMSEGVILRPRERGSWIDVVNHLRAAFVAAGASMCIGLIAVRLIPVDRLALVPLVVVTFDRVADTPRLGARALRPRGGRVPGRRRRRSRRVASSSPRSCCCSTAPATSSRRDRAAHGVPVPAGREGVPYHRPPWQAR